MYASIDNPDNKVEI